MIFSLLYWILNDGRGGRIRKKIHQTLGGGGEGASKN